MHKSLELCLVRLRRLPVFQNGAGNRTVKPNTFHSCSTGKQQENVEKRGGEGGIVSILNWEE